MTSKHNSRRALQPLPAASSSGKGTRRLQERILYESVPILPGAFGKAPSTLPNHGREAARPSRFKNFLRFISRRLRVQGLSLPAHLVQRTGSVAAIPGRLVREIFHPSVQRDELELCSRILRICSAAKRRSRGRPHGGGFPPFHSD